MARRRDSQYLGVWLDRELVEQIAARAAVLGVSKSEIVRRMIRYALAATAKGQP